MLDDIKVHVKFKLFALWTSVMFCYIYGDYFELYQPGKLPAMLAGRTALGAVSGGSPGDGRRHGDSRPDGISVAGSTSSSVSSTPSS